MSGRKFHNMLNKNCIRIHTPTLIFFYYFYKKEDNVKYTAKERPLVGHSGNSEFDLFPENVASQSCCG